MANIKTDLSKYFDVLNGNSPHERFMSFLRFAVMFFYEVDRNTLGKYLIERDLRKHICFFNNLSKRT